MAAVASNSSASSAGPLGRKMASTVAPPTCNTLQVPEGVPDRAGSAEPPLVEPGHLHTDILPWNIVEEPPLGLLDKELLPLEGSWRLISNQNYDKYLESIGVTPLMATMVLRSDYMVTLFEDIDHCWKILTETSIKAKSIRGYRTRNYKMNSNKFMLGEPKPEQLDDWDPRLVVTTLTLSEDELVLTLEQAAEKDQKFCTSSTVVMEAVDDVMTMTCETEDKVKCVRKFIRHKPHERKEPGRKLSAPF